MMIACQAKTNANMRKTTNVQSHTIMVYHLSHDYCKMNTAIKPNHKTLRTFKNVSVLFAIKNGTDGRQGGGLGVVPTSER